MSTSLICLKVWLVGRKQICVSAVIDSGASTNAISYNVVRGLGYKIDDRDKVKMATAGGTRSSMGTIEIPCITDDYELGTIKFRVIDVEMPTLIGIEFLREHGAMLCFKRNEMIIDGMHYPLLEYSGRTGIIDTKPLDDDLIKRILCNIVAHPKEEKYKKISMKSQTLNTAAYSTLMYLERIGFVRENEWLTFRGNVEDLIVY